ncbi:MAG: 1,4-dihydroxy-2-naphthoate octaprenyltransferase, partial [Myxococcota bacterium]
MTAVAERPRLVGVWWRAIRPATLTAAVGPVAVGTALAFRDEAAAPLAALAALGGAMGIQIGTNLFNDYADFQKGADTEARLGPARAMQKGWLDARQVLLGTAASFALATAFGIYLVATAGWPIVVLGLVSIACGILYTGGPAPLAYVGLGDLFVMAFFGVA